MRLQGRKGHRQTGAGDTWRGCVAFPSVCSVFVRDGIRPQGACDAWHVPPCLVARKHTAGGVNQQRRSRGHVGAPVCLLSHIPAAVPCHVSPAPVCAPSAPVYRAGPLSSRPSATHPTWSILHKPNSPHFNESRFHLNPPRTRRLAPLSEGRVETDGSLACAYHGWCAGCVAGTVAGNVAGEAGGNVAGDVAGKAGATGRREWRAWWGGGEGECGRQQQARPKGVLRW